MAGLKAPAAVLLDMDGVLFHGDRALPGAAAFLEGLRPVPHCFVTNNPIRSPSEVCAHFAALGLPVPSAGQIVTSAEATASWLATERPGFRYFAIGGGGLAEALAAHGQADPVDADYVVVGEGPGIDFAAIVTATNLVVKRGARLVCTNPDTSVDADEEGMHRVLPGGGALVAPVALASGVEPVFIGKPNPLLYRMALERLGRPAPENCIMVGDRPDTDIRGAQALGMRTALVRSGRFMPADVLPPDVRPDWDCADLVALQRHWKAEFDGF